MSRNIVLYIATSLDGYIAKKNGKVDWLNDIEMSYSSSKAYDKFYKNVDTIIMGRKTYDQIITELSPQHWIYKGKECFIATSQNRENIAEAQFINSDIVKFAKNLKKSEGGDIWLLGGSTLVDIFIKENLIDKYIITIIPTILGDGIPLFLKNNPEIKLKLVDNKNLHGVTELTYIKP